MNIIKRIQAVDGYHCTMYVLEEIEFDLNEILCELVCPISNIVSFVEEDERKKAFHIESI